jgi:hypothetical protein
MAADYATVSRVAKILARATSPVENEAKSALDHAYKRMARDGITLQDLLTLPEAELFQDALVRLVDVILSHQADLSPSAKRAAYAEYMRLIVAKFSGAGEGSASSRKSREEEAREYRERYGYQQHQQAGKDFSQENAETENSKNEKEGKRKNEQSFFRKKAPKPVAQVFDLVRPWFERGGIVWLIFHEPAAMLRVFVASLLWGMAFALVLVTVAALGHIVTETKPMVDVPFNALFGALTALGTLWRMRLFLNTAR